MIKKFAYGIGVLVIVSYALLLIALYFNQEKLLFYPQKLESNYRFSYDTPFTEMDFIMDDSARLNGLLFKADSAKGLIFYLHGNAGSLSTWGRSALPFTTNNYDCFILDYRGYGKSSGTISSEAQLHHDINTVYQTFIKQYDEHNIIIVGYSLGTGLASKLAVENNPKKLILQAPYNNIRYMATLHYPWLPVFALKYRLTTDKYLPLIQAPVVIFHGDEDILIPLECSLILQEEFNKNDELIILKGQDHHRISENNAYQLAISKILSDKN